MLACIAEKMRDMCETGDDAQLLLLRGAKEIARLEMELAAARDDARHHEEVSKYWEAKVIALQERLALCGKR